MMLFENIGIGVAEEFGYFRAYAFNAVTEENIASCKCEREGGAVAGIFHELRNKAINRMEA